MAPAAASYNYSQDVTRSHESATRLPPISSLLERPEAFSPHQGSDSSKSRNDRDDSRNHPSHLDSSRRSPYDRRSEAQSNGNGRPHHSPSEDRQRDRSSYRPQLPMPSGTPGSHDRHANGWSDRGSASRGPYDYQGGPAQPNVSPYGGPPSGSREPGSSLPPPPPFQNGQPSNYRPGPGAYGPDTSYGPTYGAHPGHSPTYPPNGYSNGAPYPPHQRPDMPSPYHEAPPGNYPRDHGPGMPMYDALEDRPTRRRRGNLPKWATDYLKQWFFDHIAHPYPTEQEKQELCKITGLGMTQLSNWFINARRRQNPVLHAQAQAEGMIRDGSSQASSEHAP